MTRHGIPDIRLLFRERRAIPRAVRGRGAMIVSRRWLERCWIDRSTRVTSPSD